MDSTRVLAFCGSFALIAASPGLCMTLAMSLGIAHGVRRTLWMMAGELLGIALVGAAAMAGVAALLLGDPRVFWAFKVAGAAYLLYAAWGTWHAPIAHLQGAAALPSRRKLWLQGFATAVSNPKAWAFNMALLPPFIDATAPLAPQMAVLLAIMLVIEFASLLAYAAGGRALAEVLLRQGKAVWLQRVAALLMLGVAVWLLWG